MSSDHELKNQKQEELTLSVRAFLFRSMFDALHGQQTSSVSPASGRGNPADTLSGLQLGRTSPGTQAGYHAPHPREADGNQCQNPEGLPALPGTAPFPLHAETHGQDPGPYPPIPPTYRSATERQQLWSSTTASDCSPTRQFGSRSGDFFARKG